MTAVRRRRRRRRRSALLGAAAAFVLICGALLLLGGGDSGAVALETRKDRARRALGATRMAERALDSENYGDARAHLREAQNALLPLVTEPGAKGSANDNQEEDE